MPRGGSLSIPGDDRMSLQQGLLKSFEQDVQPLAWLDLPKTMAVVRRPPLLAARLSIGVRYLSDPR